MGDAVDKDGCSKRNFRLFSVAILGVTIIISAINVFARLRMEEASTIQNGTVILGVMITLGAGWTTVRNFRLGLWHTVLLGMILSFGSHWTLPIFHRGAEIPGLALINTAIFIVMTLAGGLVAMAFMRFTGRRKG